MTPLPPIRFPVSKPWVGPKERRAVVAAMSDGQLSQGPRVLRFEQQFAKWVGTREGVATANGTVALHLVLAALMRLGKLKEGDEVIVPTLTYVATANAARYCGLTVVLADVDPLTWCLSPRAVAWALTERTRAVIPVHLYGHLADVGEIRRTLDVVGSPALIIEDAAEAHGACCGERMAGSLATAGVFSFYGNKILSTGEGGMVTTDCAPLAEACRHLRGHAMIAGRRFVHDQVGFNYRMTELQAAVGGVQLEEAEAHVGARRQIARWYREALRGAPVTWQRESGDADPVWWLPTVLLPAGVREMVAEGLRAEGIDTRPAFAPLHGLPMYAQPLRPGAQCRFPNAEAVGRCGLSLPSYRGLTKADVREICHALRRYLE